MKQKSLRTKGLELIREKHLALQEEFKKMERAFLPAQAQARRLTIEQAAIVSKFEALLSAITILAGGVPKDTPAGKDARSKARAVLSEAGVKPPMSLGSPRSTKTKRRKKKVVTKRSKHPLAKSVGDTWLDAVASGEFEASLRRAPHELDKRLKRSR